VNFTLATTESWKDKQGVKQSRTEWHKCTAFRKLAEIIGQYCQKGSKVYIEGKLRTRQWEQDGIKRYTTEISVDQLQMLDSRQDGQAPAPRQQAPQQAPQQQPQGGFDSDFDDSDIPF
jgi:single-strand DNA-binding protein